MSRPVRLDGAVANEAPDYGTGFAPFFVPLSLWVGAMVVFMVLPALSARALVSSVPSWRVALAGRVVPLTSAGGTYPVETSPAFFQAVGPFLPLSWAVTAPRHLISGGDTAPVWSAFGVTSLWLVVPLLLT